MPTAGLQMWVIHMQNIAVHAEETCTIHSRSCESVLHRQSAENALPSSAQTRAGILFFGKVQQGDLRTEFSIIKC